MSDQAVKATDTPPPQYVGYTRPNAVPGSPEQLEALADAYVGIQWVFIWNAILTVLLWIVFGMIGGQFGDDDITLLVSFVVIATITTMMSLRPCRRYAIGLGRSPSSGVATAVALGIQSWFCFGLFGYSSVMGRVVKEIKRYGVRPRFWGIYGADVAVRAAELRSNPVPPPPAVPPSAQNP